MNTPLSWLREFVEIDVDIDTLCKKLVAIGFEVEEVKYLGEGIENVVVGQIKSIAKHSDADKLIVCQIDVGQETLQIVTGADNVNVGDKVPVAKHKSKLPNGKEITKGKLRGIESNGMLCSGSELQINDDMYSGASVDGILILSKNAKVGDNIIHELGLDDYIIDVAITSNRPDCNSIVGVAREVAVALNKKMKMPKTDYICQKNTKIEDYVKVDVLATDLCPTYLAHAIKDVVIRQSPLWMRQRLYKVGLKGINNIVDITNYVLMEMGQPMHAFDQKQILNKHIIVRRANESETIIPFDNNEYTLNKNVLVIADEKRAVGLAGIMGGQNSGIATSTNTVVFEAAKFKRESIRHTSRTLGIRSDSSARFEKGIDSYTTELALNRALHLVNELECGNIVGTRAEIKTEKVFDKTIEFEYSRVKKILGIDIPKEIALSILDNLNIKTTMSDTVIKCVVPGYREDIEQDCDIIEELIRVYGYDHIIPTLLDQAAITNGGKSTVQKHVSKMVEILIGLNYSEITTYSFGGKSLYDKLNIKSDNPLYNNIIVKNPLGEELSRMRTTLVCNMLNVISTNYNRKNPSANLFEYAKVYLAKSLPLTELPLERNMLCLGQYGANVDFFQIKSTLEILFSQFGTVAEYKRINLEYLHPGVSADILVNGESIGFVGMVHPQVAENYNIKDTYIAQIDFDLFLKKVAKFQGFKPILKYPSIDRDLSIVVNDKVAVGELLDDIKNISVICESVDLFDIYKGNQVANDSKSVSVSIKYRATDKTLTDDEVEKVINKTLKMLTEKYNAKLR